MVYPTEDLDEGFIRQIHVSRSRITQGNGRCIIVERPEEEEPRLFSSAIEIKGPSRVVYSKDKIPGGANVWVETESRLLVFDPQISDE